MPDKDIFDKLAASSKGGGDIFDQLAAKSNPEQNVPDAAMQAHQQMITGGKNLMGASGYPELANAKPGGASLSKVGQPPQEASVEGTLGALPAVGGTVGGAFGGIPGAALGGGAGEAANQLIRRAAGDVPVTSTPGTDIAKQGAIMGAAEGVGKYAIAPLVKWMLASKTVGAKLLQQASAKAGNAPVQLSPETDAIVEKIVQEGKSGGTIPKVISDLLDRVGPSTRQAAEAVPGPLTYGEARLFQSNASQLSTAEQMTLKGRMKSLMPQFAKSFADDVQAAANQAGVGTEHATGMKEYATAAARDRALTRMGKVAVPIAKGALAGLGGGAAYEAYRTMKGRR